MQPTAEQIKEAVSKCSEDASLEEIGLQLEKIIDPTDSFDATLLTEEAIAQAKEDLKGVDGAAEREGPQDPPSATPDRKAEIEEELDGLAEKHAELDRRRQELQSELDKIIIEEEANKPPNILGHEIQRYLKSEHRRRGGNAKNPAGPAPIDRAMTNRPRPGQNLPIQN